MMRIPLPEGFPLAIRSRGYEATVRFYPEDGRAERVTLEALREWLEESVRACNKALEQEEEA